MPWTVKGRCTQIAGNGDIIFLRFKYVDHKKLVQKVAATWVVTKWITAPSARLPDWGGDGRRKPAEITIFNRKNPRTARVRFGHLKQKIEGEFKVVRWYEMPPAVAAEFRAIHSRPVLATYRRRA